MVQAIDPNNGLDMQRFSHLEMLTKQRYMISINRYVSNCKFNTQGY